MALQILAKGPQISMGYLNNETETQKSFDIDGFLHTGDLGSIGQDGLVIIHDRIKELIKVSIKLSIITNYRVAYLIVTLFRSEEQVWHQQS